MEFIAATGVWAARLGKSVSGPCRSKGVQMSRWVRRVLAPLFLVALVASVLPTLLVAAPARAATSCSNTEIAATPARIAEVRAAVLCLINEERAAQGLGRLRLSTQLDQASALHGTWMAKTHVFAHHQTGPGALATMRERVDAVGYDWRELGENLASGQRTPAEVVREWLLSPSHLSTIRMPNVVDFGLDLNDGYVVVDGVPASPIWTTVFGRSASSTGGDLPAGSVTGKKSKLRVKASGGKGRATFAITVRAGKRPAKGKVLVLRDGVLLKRTKVKAGKGRVMVTVGSQPKGRHVYTVVYLGNAKTKSSQRQVRVKVR